MVFGLEVRYMCIATSNLATTPLVSPNRVVKFGNERFNSHVGHSLFVGESGNKGNPTTPAEIAYGRSLPKPKIPDFPTRGYEYYDYRNEVADTKFVNYQDNAVRKTGALSWLLYTSAGVTTSSSIERATFVNAEPVYFPKYDARFDNDNRGGIGYRTSSIHDLDGSVTGIPNSQIIINDGEDDSVAVDSTCKIEPTWNAAVCTGDVGLLHLADTSTSDRASKAHGPLARRASGRSWAPAGRWSGRSGCPCRSGRSAKARRLYPQRQGISPRRRPEHCAGRAPRSKSKTERPQLGSRPG